MKKLSETHESELQHIYSQLIKSIKIYEIYNAQENNKFFLSALLKHEKKHAVFALRSENIIKHKVVSGCVQKTNGNT